MKLLADLHNHTVASAHAYSTILENARSAAEKGIAIVAITDHGPALEDSPHPLHFMNYHVLDKTLFGVEMLYGIELNILDFDGKIDLEQPLLDKMDIGIASIHSFVTTPGSMQQNTRAYCKAMENPKVNIIGHPDDGNVPVDFAELARQAQKMGVALEVNNSSLKTAFFRKNTRENLLAMLAECGRFGTYVSVGSDSHFAPAVGELSMAESLLEEAGFPPELVLNTDRERLLGFLARKVSRG